MTPQEREAKIGELLSDCSARQLAEMYAVAMEAAQSRLMAVKGRPLGDRVLIKVLDPQQGSLRRPQNVFPFAGFAGRVVQDDQGYATIETPPPPVPARGVVVAVGPGYVVHGVDERHYVALDLKPGDEVLFFPEAATLTPVAGEDLYLTEEIKVLMVLDSIDGDPARAGVTEGEPDAE